MRAELHFLGLEVDLLTTGTHYDKPFQWEEKGIPAFYNQGGLLQFFFAYGQKHNRFLERMTTIDYDLHKRGYPLDEGKVVFYDSNDDILKSWKFKDAAIQKFKVTFNANGGGMVVEMLLSPAIQDYGCKVVRHWHGTPIEDETYRSPVYAVGEQEDFKLEKFLWIDDKDDSRVKSTEIGNNVRAFVKVAGIAVGEKVAMTLFAKSSGKELSKYQGEVINKFGGVYAYCDVTIENSWDINMVSEEGNVLDSIYMKASYKSENKNFEDNTLDVVVQRLKGIKLVKGNDEAFYFEGNLYKATKNGKGMFPYGERPRRLFREIQSALDIISSKPIGKGFIEKIENRSNPRFITITRKGLINKTASLNVYWTPGDKNGGLDEKGNTKRKPFISLVHELWHAWENWLRISDDTIWIEKTDTYKEQSCNELSASLFENKIRSEHNLPKRKWYGYIIEEDGTKTGYGKIF